MQHIDTLIFPRWIIPIEPSNTVLEGYAIAINEGKIVEILSIEQAEKKYQAKETCHRHHHVVMPGLVNAHTHSPMVLFRGLADDLPLMTWLKEYIWPAENQWLSEPFVADGTQLAILEMLRSGTTCFNEHYLFPNVIAKTALEMNMRACIGIFLIGAPTAWAKTMDEYIEKGLLAYNEFNNKHNEYNHKHELITFSMAPHAPYTMPDDALLAMKALAEQYQLPIHMHVHETIDEVNLGLTQNNMRPLKRLFKLGVLSNKFQNVHMTQITDEDIEILQETQAHVIHCPESNLKLASGFCPVQKLLNAKINVALGTDSAASNNDLDMFSELRTAALIGKVIANDPTAISAITALEMATINGAKALGLDHKIGSLKPNKAADMIAIDLEQANTMPIYHPISHLAYAANSQQVSDVWIAGKHLLKEKQFTQYDEKEILEKVKKWQNKILNKKQARSTAAA